MAINVQYGQESNLLGHLFFFSFEIACLVCHNKIDQLKEEIQWKEYLRVRHDTFKEKGS